MSTKRARRRRREQRRAAEIAAEHGIISEYDGGRMPMKRELRRFEFMGNPQPGVWRLCLVSIARAAAENANGGGFDLRNQYQTRARGGQ